MQNGIEQKKRKNVLPKREEERTVMLVEQVRRTVRSIVESDRG